MLSLLFAVLLAQAHPLTLDEAVRLGLQRNADLRKQALLALSAEQEVVTARSQILPRLDFNASAVQERAAGEVVVAIGPTYSGDLRLSQLIFDGGKWWNGISAADLGAQAAGAQVDEQRLQIAYLIEQRFYELVRAQRQLAVLGEAAQRSRDQADFTQRLFDGGRATQADVYAARANRDNDEVNRLGQERAVELARSDLSTAIGLDPGSPLSVAEPPNLMAEPASPPAITEAVQRALSQRPSLKAFALTVDQNRKGESVARGDYWPSLSGFASWGRATGDLSVLGDRPDINSKGALGVQLTWNIFGGLATRAAVQKAEIQTQIAQNDLDNGRRAVASDVEKAVAQLSTARAQARVARQAEQTAKEGLRLARTRQEVGVGTQLEVRDAELKLTQAQLSVVGSLLDGRVAEAALKRAQGGT